MLLAGFARVDITPPTANSLLGYDFRQQHLPPGNSGVHDPLYARTLVLHDGVAPAAIVSLDLCILLPPMARRLRARIAETIGTTPERVLLACTHTHSGPFPMEAGTDSGKFLSAFMAEAQQNPDQAYAETLAQKLATGAALAANLLFPVRVESQQAPCAVAYTRRQTRPDGSVTMVWNPQEARPDLPGPPGGLVPTADPACTLISLRQTNGPRQFHLFSVGAHPTVLGKTSTCISADYPGLACAQLEAASPYTGAMFLLGPCGDTHAWIATQESYEGVRTVASAVSSFVSLLAGALQPGGDALAIATQTVQIGKTDLDLAAWRLGEALILAAPVELFAALGAALRDTFPARHLIIATNTQGWTGYWPTQAAFAQGQYEVDAAKAMGRSAGDGATLVAQLGALAGRVLAPGPALAASTLHKPAAKGGHHGTRRHRGRKGQTGKGQSQ